MGEIYRGSLRVEIVDVLADDQHAIVLTRESGAVQGEAVAWTCVHHWTLTGRRLAGFEVHPDGAYDRF